MINKLHLIGRARGTASIPQETRRLATGLLLIALGAQAQNSLPLPAGTSLQKGTKYAASSGVSVTFQTDGNLVVKDSKDAFFWGLNESSKNFAKTASVELRKDGSFGAYDASGAPVWTAPLPKSDPKSRLNVSADGQLQVEAANGEVLWSTAFRTGSSVFVSPRLPACTPEPGWDKCIEIQEPKIKVMGLKATSWKAVNASANIYREMTRRFTAAYPKNKMDDYKIYLSNGQPWSELEKVSPIGTMWRDKTGESSGDWLRGGTSANWLWIDEQMICKTGVKTRGDKDKEQRTFDQVIHEFGHAIAMRYGISDATLKTAYPGDYPAVEAFPWNIQHWFGSPKGNGAAAGEKLVGGIFSSRATFSCEMY